MQSSRTIYRVPIPNACRVQRAVSPAALRSAHFAHSPFFSRGLVSPSVIGSDFAPLFRILDDQLSRAFDFPTQTLRRTVPAYQPRFDVEEIEGGYELRGELPGVEGEDLSVEFTDAQTLVIKGRTERQSTNGSTKADAVTAQDAAAETTIATEQVNATATTEAENDDARSIRSHSSASSYVQPTVEDEETGTIERSVGAASTTETQPQQQQQVAEQTQSQPEPTSRYWVSERSVGEFQRTFNFPERINQDGVTASLKNGVLNISVPKAVAPVARRIVVA